MTKRKSTKARKGEDPSSCTNEKQWFEKYPTAMNIYRDIEGKFINKVESKHLYFPCWPESRIDPKACLPLYYATGARFIKLEWEKPLNFRCKEFPMNLREVHAKKAQMKAATIKEKKEQRFRKQVLEECKKKGLTQK